MCCGYKSPTLPAITISNRCGEVAIIGACHLAVIALGRGSIPRTYTFLFCFDHLCWLIGLSLPIVACTPLSRAPSTSIKVVKWLRRLP